MQRLKQLLHILQTNGFFTTKNKTNFDFNFTEMSVDAAEGILKSYVLVPPSRYTKVFLEKLERINPIVFWQPPTVAEVENILSNYNPDQPLSAPFSEFSIELACGNPLAILSENNDAVNVKTYCVAVLEQAPGAFESFILVEARSPSGPQIGVIHANTHHLLTTFLAQFNAGLVGQEHVRERVVIGTGAQKRIHRIRRIVHIRPKSTSAPATGSSREIDWSHRWLVRGHWRKIDGLGKDRLGDYCVQGFTWVAEFQKGPEDAPLVRKTRLVHDSKENIL